MRIMSSVEDDLLISSIPKVFVEESFFDMCKIMVDENGVISQGLYSIDDGLTDLDFTSATMLNNGASHPSLVDDVFGYGVLYVYPLKKDLRVIGYILLGKRYYMDVETRLLRELEIVCDIYNKSLLLSDNGKRRGTGSRAALEMAIEEFPDAFLIIDNKSYICYANKKAKTEFEAKRGLLVGEKMETIVPAGIDGGYTAKNRVLYGEINYKLGDAHKMFKIEIFPLKQDMSRGELRGVILKDVVEKRISEEEHLLKQKMESIGLLAGGIAHDFNNMLTGILGYASLMKKFLADNEKLERYAVAIEHSAQRASKLTQHLLNFSRRQKKIAGIMNINDLLEDVLFLLKESFRDINIEKDLDPSLPSVKGEEAELQNVFLNLFINARDAMNGQGSLKVSTRREKCSGESKEFITIIVEDTGKGIDEELQKKIFEPYFTTKKGTSNLGMGLYLVDRVIKEHGGFIDIKSKKGEGTQFSVYIPIPRSAGSKSAEAESVPSKDVLKEKSVLIVDDEGMIRELIDGALTDAGVRTHEAANGEEAVMIFTKYSDNIDAVFLDMIMPGMKGDEVLRRLREIRKETKVIIASGFMSEEQRNKLKKLKVEAFLDKPFTDNDILQTLRKVLSK